MNEYMHREFATSLTAVTFVVIGATGILMFFHLFESQVKSLHEILGLVFVGAVFLHLFFNWKSMRRYFAKQVFVTTTIAAAAVSIVFVVSADTGGGNPKGAVIKAVLDAPLETSLGLLGGDADAARARLLSEGIRLEGAASIEAVARANGLSPFAVVQIVSR